MIADVERAPVRYESPAPPRLAPTEIRNTTTLMVGRTPTARECGLRAEKGLPGDTRWCDIIPELMIELI